MHVGPFTLKLVFKFWLRIYIKIGLMREAITA